MGQSTGVMSKFFAQAGDSDSESESGSESEDEKNLGKTEFAGYGGYDSSSSEEEEKREVKSKKDKSNAVTNAILTKLKNHTNISDWKGAYDDFSDLLKVCTKSKTEDDMKVLVKTICKVEDDIEGGAWAEKKKLHKDNQRALTRLRQDIRKMIAVGGTYHDSVAALRAAPQEASDFEESESESDSDSSDSDSDDSSDDAPKKKTSGKKSAVAEESDESDWGSDSSDSSDGDSEDEGGYVPSRDRWLKKTEVVDAVADKETAVDRRRRRQIAEIAQVMKQNGAVSSSIPGDASEGWTWLSANCEIEKGNALGADWDWIESNLKTALDKATIGDAKVVAKEKEWTADQINKKLKEIISGRGKRGTDRMESVRQLEDLMEKVKTGSKRTEIMVHLISCLFDSNPNMLTFLHVDTWKKTATNILALLDLLKENPEIVLHEGEPPETSDDVEAQGENEDGEIAPVTANLLGFLERLDDELNKSYQSLDPSLNEYLQRLKDEAVIEEVARGIEAYYASKNNMVSVASAARRRVEHLYWRTMTRVMLCQIFHYAQKGEFYRARDMLLMSHLQDTIQMSDIGTQILFNRTMVQLGLAAFVHGLITDAHNCLAEVLAGSRGKELLAQGLSSSRFAERDQEQEREERRRQ